MMKKLLLAILLGFCCLGSWAQDLVNIQVDERISLKMPSDYQILDTLGATTFLAFTPSGNMSVSKVQASKEAIKSTTMRNENQLRDMYESIVKDAQKKGLAVHEYRIEEMRGLLVLKMMLNVTVNEGVTSLEQWQLYLDGTYYAFQYVIPDSLVGKPVALANQKTFFEGIQVQPRFTMADQFEEGTGKSLAYQLGYMTPYMLIGAGVGIYYLVRSIRRSKKV